MQYDELMELASKVAALMEQFERRCETLEERLQGLAQQLPVAFRQSSDGLLQHLPGQVLNKVREGLDRPLNDYEQRLRGAQGGLSEGSRIIDGQIRRLEALHRGLAWKVLGVTCGCLALLLAGGIWLSMHYARVIEENQLNADLLRRYNIADVVPCGEQLCANVDPKGPRAGDHQQYLPIRTR